ncbi:unnamed protein product [Dovyalis caffra]|uniref:Uncharacterized protein n=1 Tax=Dovyalis caffra TaxID=77055 RepID=A0AAV1R6K7_9ROSI|nr:unnamed protein product [Dovyalis caffra]
MDRSFPPSSSHSGWVYPEVKKEGKEEGFFPREEGRALSNLRLSLWSKFHCRIDLGIGSHPNSSSCPKVLYESRSTAVKVRFLSSIERKPLLAFFASLA